MDMWVSEVGIGLGQLEKYAAKRQQRSLISKILLMMGYPKLFMVAIFSGANLIGNYNFQNFIKRPSFRTSIVEILFFEVSFYIFRWG